MPYGGLSAHGYQTNGPLAMAHALHMSNLNQRQQQQPQQQLPQQQPQQQLPQQQQHQQQSMDRDQKGV